MPIETNFGCCRCFGESAEAVYRELPKFTELARLVDEWHFIVRIVSCPDCHQRYVSVFTEWVDHANGEDPQYRSVLPLTVKESEQLMSQGENVDVHLIETLGAARRYLSTNWPSGKAQTVYWGQGHLLIGPHD